MKIADLPTYKFQIPFAADAGGGYIRTIPVASQIGIQDGAASLHDGFPPINFLPVGSGGIPPFGQDFNGLLNAISAWTRWQNAGALVQYDSGFSTAVGGYPVGAIVASTSAGGVWLCTLDDNTGDPDAGAPGWVRFATVNDVFGGAWMTVLSITTTTPPGSPTVGDAYLIPLAGASGAWAGQGGKIAWWNGTTWTFITPPNGHHIGTPDGAEYVRNAGAYRGMSYYARQNDATIPVKGWVTTAPGAPSEGDRYIVNAGATGAFAGQDQKIAVYAGGAWKFFAAVAGLMASYPTGGLYLQPLWFNGTIWQQALVILTPIIKTVHGVGADFADLNAAFTWLSNYRIAQTGSVTFQLAGGVGASASIYNGSGNTVVFDHPDSGRVIIRGATMTGAFPTYSAWSITGSSSGARATDNVTNLAMLRTRYATELKFAAGAYMDLRGSPTFQDLLLTGDGTTVIDGMYCRFGAASLVRVSAHGFGRRGITVAAGYIGAENVSGSGCAISGISAEINGAIGMVSGELLGMSNTTNGILALSGSDIRQVDGATMSALGNGGSGVDAEETSAIITQSGSRSNTNGGSGWVALDNSYVEAGSTTATGNANYGYYSQGASRINAFGATATGNGVGGISANQGSANLATSLTGTLSPASNTVGNGNSINVQ